MQVQGFKRIFQPKLCCLRAIALRKSFFFSNENPVFRLMVCLIDITQINTSNRILNYFQSGIRGLSLPARFLLCCFIFCIRFLGTNHKLHNFPGIYHRFNPMMMGFYRKRLLINEVFPHEIRIAPPDNICCIPFLHWPECNPFSINHHCPIFPF